MNELLIKKAFQLGYSRGLKKRAARDFDGMRDTSGRYHPSWEEKQEYLHDSKGNRIRPLTHEEKVKNLRDSAIFGAGTTAAMTYPLWGPTAMPYLKAIGRNWLFPGSSLIKSPNMGLRLLGHAYKKALPFVQFNLPFLLNGLDDETLEKLPDWAKKLPAVTQLLSPKGIGAALAYRSLGYWAGRNPEDAGKIGQHIGNFGSNLATHVATGRGVPLVLSKDNLTLSSSKNFQQGVVKGVTGNPKTKQTFVDAANRGYDSVRDSLPSTAQAAFDIAVPRERFMNDISQFLDNPYSENVTFAKNVAGSMRDALRVPNIAELPGMIARKWKSLSPRTKRSIIRGGVRAGVAGYKTIANSNKDSSQLSEEIVDNP